MGCNMINAIKLFFILAAMLSLLFIAGGIGHKSIDMILFGSSCLIGSTLILSLLNFAKA